MVEKVNTVELTQVDLEYLVCIWVSQSSSESQIHWFKPNGLGQSI